MAPNGKLTYLRAVDRPWLPEHRRYALERLLPHALPNWEFELVGEYPSVEHAKQALALWREEPVLLEQRWITVSEYDRPEMPPLRLLPSSRKHSSTLLALLDDETPAGKSRASAGAASQKKASAPSGPGTARPRRTTNTRRQKA